MGEQSKIILAGEIGKGFLDDDEYLKLIDDFVDKLEKIPNTKALTFTVLHELDPNGKRAKEVKEAEWFKETLEKADVPEAHLALSVTDGSYVAPCPESNMQAALMEMLSRASASTIRSFFEASLQIFPELRKAFAEMDYIEDEIAAKSPPEGSNTVH